MKKALFRLLRVRELGQTDIEVKVHYGALGTYVSYDSNEDRGFQEYLQARLDLQQHNPFIFWLASKLGLI